MKNPKCSAQSCDLSEVTDILRLNTSQYVMLILRFAVLSVSETKITLIACPGHHGFSGRSVTTLMLVDQGSTLSHSQLTLRMFTNTRKIYFSGNL